jgi:hypothetical protein
MDTLNDVTLIQQFVTEKAVFVANQNLRIEPALGANQLLAKNGELLATIDLTTKPTVVAVRQGCDYWTLLHEVLSDQGFMLSGEAPQLGFVRYEAQIIPVGYRMNCAEARVLWKVWSEKTRPTRHDICLDLLIFERGMWHPIQEVACQRGIVSIKTLITTLNLQDGDYVTWIQQIPDHQSRTLG